MHVHNVSSYAPPGHKLARTEYIDGRTVHVFTDSSGAEARLEFFAADAAEERGYLEKFQAMHTPKAPEPRPALVEPLPAPVKPRRRT